MEGMPRRTFSKRDGPSAGPFWVRIVRPVGRVGDGSWGILSGGRPPPFPEPTQKHDPRPRGPLHAPDQLVEPGRPAAGREKKFGLWHFRPEQDQLATF